MRGKFSRGNFPFSGGNYPGAIFRGGNNPGAIILEPSACGVK